jgi:putative ABC transport system permease protein
MKTVLAWRNLTHSKVRTAASTAGIAFVILLIFVQLGLYAAVVHTATQAYDRLNFDLVLISPHHVFINWTGMFPRRRLYQALTVDGVVQAMPFYIALPVWQNPYTRLRYKIRMMAFHPADPVFLLPELTGQLDALRQPDTVLIDRSTRPELGPQTPGMVTELNRRTVTIGGQYTLDMGFGALGSIITSDQNFSRFLHGYALEQVHLGLITLAPGFAPEVVAARLRGILPSDVQVLTRAELKAREERYWVDMTAIGIIFGTGTVVAFLVGTVVLYQVLSNDVTNHFAEYATLKALGYTDMRVSLVVLAQGCILAVLGFVPALLLSFGVYEVIRTTAHLSVSMTLRRIVFVLIMVIVMCAMSGLMALHKVKKTDPAELF